VKSFRALDLAKEYDRLTRDLKISGHLAARFSRACSSVALNLAEGNAKRSEKEKLRFYEIALGSFRESLTILNLEKITNGEVRKVADHLGASLLRLTRTLINKVAQASQMNLKLD
jgi:four helix bundle protein